MAIQGITPAFDPPSTPWWKKALGLIGAIGGVAAAPFTAGGSAVAAGIGAGSGLLGTAGALAPGGKVKGESKVIAPTGSSAGQTGISPVKPQAQREQGNTGLESLTTGLNAVGGIINKASSLVKQRPEIGKAFVSDAQKALATPEAQSLLGPQAQEYEKFLMSAADYWNKF